jgi:hypothetical protein
VRQREATLRRLQSEIQRGVDPARERELVFHGSNSCSICRLAGGAGGSIMSIKASSC